MHIGLHQRCVSKDIVIKKKRHAAEQEIHLKLYIYNIYMDKFQYPECKSNIYNPTIKRQQNLNIGKDLNGCFLQRIYLNRFK